MTVTKGVNASHKKERLHKGESQEKKGGVGVGNNTSGLLICLNRRLGRKEVTNKGKQRVVKGTAEWVIRKKTCFLTGPRNGEGGSLGGGTENRCQGRVTVGKGTGG